MMTEIIAMAVLAVPCMLLGAFAAIALWKFQAGWTVGLRTCLASIVSISPILILTAIATGGSPELLFTMSPDEFLVPFSLQIALTLALAGPVTWLVSRRRKEQQSLADVFE